MPTGVPMTGFRGWRGVVAEDATVETSTGFAACREGAGTAEVRTGLPGWTAVSPDDATAVVRTEAAGPRATVPVAGEGTAFTACRGTAADVLARTGVTTTGAVTAADEGFTAGRAVVATAEVAAPVEGAGAAEGQVETSSWVGAGCSIHSWIKL